MGNCCENNTVKELNPDDLTGNKIEDVSSNVKEGENQTEVLEQASKEPQVKEEGEKGGEPEAEPIAENGEEIIEFEPGWNRPIPKAMLLAEFVEIPAAVNDMLEKHKDNEHMEKIVIPGDPTKPMLGPYCIGKSVLLIA